ncbi:MAG TPA: ACT domain-containing protein [Acidimicrobiales bacterium]|nr:ACT domain-containing protein [Acidimicrobiales bacterium]
MPSFVVRVWLPDRPGALGAVASRIGAVRGDVVGIEILERGGGRAVDDLVVALPDADLVPLMVREVNQVDGVDVEDVRPAAAQPVDAGLRALESAAVLVDQGDAGSLLRELARCTADDCGGDWCAVVDPSRDVPLATAGAVPADPWIVAFVRGSRAQPAMPGPGADRRPEDIMWAEMAAAGAVLVVGRAGRPFRARERRQVAAVARIADRRLAELARTLHPSRA